VSAHPRHRRRATGGTGRQHRPGGAESDAPTLVSLRRDQGRLEEAERLIVGFEDQPAAVGAIARIHLLRGRAATAETAPRRHAASARRRARAGPALVRPQTTGPGSSRTRRGGMNQLSREQPSRCERCCSTCSARRVRRCLHGAGRRRAADGDVRPWILAGRVFRLGPRRTTVGTRTGRCGGGGAPS
jgi:hypothetical protein